MISLSFTPEDVKQLRHQRFYHPDPHVQRKMEALLLKSASLPHYKIAFIVGISPNTLRTYLAEYQEGGVEGLKQTHFYSPSSALSEHRSTLENYFHTNPPATIKEAATRIEELTGIKRSLTQVRSFLKSLGLKRRKVGSIPSKADTAKQQDFRENELEPRLEEARQRKRAVFFVDAVHFVFAPFLGYLWSLTRLFVKAPSGRKRFNLLGALNAVTYELIQVTNHTYINAQSVCELLRKIACQNLSVPITLVLDNARYQKCAIVRDLAASLEIELLYLPSYSPNLNLIERLWKLVKKQCLYSKYYPDFPSFCQAICSFFEEMQTKYKPELISLLTHKFQDLAKVQLRLVA